MGCPFCSRDSLATRIIAENESALAFPTNIPIVPGHVLVVPKRHVERYEELTPGEKDGIETLRTRLTRALATSFSATGFNYAWNDGAVAGQSVPHFHLHVVPRKEGDAGVHQYEPREFLYRPGSRDLSPDAELEEVAKEIRSAL